MDKTDSLLIDLEKALQKFREASVLPPSEINRDATIQRFEFCFELAWKMMQGLLADNGIEAYGPRNSIREAAKLGLLDNPEEWFEFLKARNLTTHTYKEEIAKEVYKKVKTFVGVLEKFLKVVRK